MLIARIAVASTTRDVTCEYVHRGKSRFHYRVVDEYDGETLTGRKTRTSTRPLSQVGLADLFDGTWSIFDVLAMNFGHRGYDENQMQRFGVEVGSNFYPELDALYRSRIRAWAAAKRLDVGNVGGKGVDMTEDEKLAQWRTSAVRRAGWVPVGTRQLADLPGEVNDALQGAIVVSAAGGEAGMSYQ